MQALVPMFFRRKLVDMNAETKLERRLGVIDLIGLGVGATLGAGVYVLTGVVAKTEAGPAIVVSFFISGMASILSGLCYAEFGARVPIAGSAYVYSYVTVGELLAWTTGWQLLLEYVIGASSVARSWSGYVDSLTNGAITSGIAKHVGTMNLPGLAQDPDLLGFGMTMLLSCIVSVGVKESTSVNNVLTSINLIVIAFVIIAGAFFSSPSNMVSHGGFAPNGFGGIFKGAATSFYAYVGFDVIATSAEETKNPAKAIPVSIITSLILCAGAYMAVSGIVTSMVPWNQLDDTAPLSMAFGAHNAAWAKYIISVGAICGLSTSLMTCIFPMPRIIYAIAEDGLIPPWFGAVHKKFGTPVNATMLCGFFAAFMCLIFDIEALADMMSIGTLISYTLVAASVLVLRYRFENGESSHAAPTYTNALEEDDSRESLLPTGGAVGSSVPLFHGRTPYSAASLALVLFTFFIACASIPTTIFLNNDVSSSHLIVGYVFIALSLAGASACIVVLLKVPSEKPDNLAFQCPGMPWVPLISIAVNVYLLVSLSPMTWVRFGAWCAVGTAIYAFYGLKHSKAGIEKKNDSLIELS